MPRELVPNSGRVFLKVTTSISREPRGRIKIGEIQVR